MNESVKAIETAPGMQTFEARIVPGHRVASGENRDPRFPGGTIRMQIPHFQRMGLDLSSFYPGTINVSIAPLHYQVRAPYRTLPAVKWHPTEPEEDFSFFEVDLLDGDNVRASGFIYYPHPDTKPEHFQQADVLELLLPHVSGLGYGDILTLRTRPDQIAIVGTT